VSNLCEIEELCQYDRSCPFYAENCRKTEHRVVALDHLVGPEIRRWVIGQWRLACGVARRAAARRFGAGIRAVACKNFF